MKFKKNIPNFRKNVLTIPKYRIIVLLQSENSERDP